MQKNRPVVLLQLGDQAKWVELICPIAVVIGDGKSSDMLCGKKQSKSNTNRLLPGCVCHSNNADNPDYNCRWLLMKEMMDIIYHLKDKNGRWKLPKGGKQQDVDELFEKARALLDKLSAHRVENAFEDVCFGGDPQGIFGAIAVDPMHVVEEGIIKYICLILMALLTTQPKKELDDLVDTLICATNSSSRKNFPRCNFSKGFTNLTLLSATEIVGIAFTFLLLARTDKGIAVLTGESKRKKGGKWKKGKKGQKMGHLSATELGLDNPPKDVEPEEDYKADEFWNLVEEYNSCILGENI